MERIVGDQRLIIGDLPVKYISEDGVLDLTKKFPFSNPYLGEALQRVPLGIYLDSVKGTVRKIIFPSNFRLFTPKQKKLLRSLNYTGVREFNIPEDQGVIYFSGIVAAIDISLTIEKLKNGKGPLKYSELIIVLNLTQNKVNNLLSYYKSTTWLSNYIEKTKKEIIENEQNSQTYDANQKKIIVKLSEALLLLIVKGYLFNIEWTIDDVTNLQNSQVKETSLFKIDSDGKMLIIYKKDGDTYKIKIDNTIEYNNYSIILPKEATDAYITLFTNNEIITDILTRLEEDMEEDKEKIKLQAVKQQEESQRQRDLEERVASIILDSRIQHALMRKRNNENNDPSKIYAKLSVEPSFIITNIDIIKELGLIPYFDFSKIELSEINPTGVNLSYSNIKGKMKEGLNLKGTNLTDVNLSGQWITNQDIRGANLSMTHAMIIVPCLCDETTIFDETCFFTDYKGERIPFDVLRKDGYNIRKKENNVYEMTLGSERFYVYEPTYEQLVALGASQSDIDIFISPSKIRQKRYNALN